MVLSLRTALLSMALILGQGGSKAGTTVRHFEEFAVPVTPVKHPAEVKIATAEERSYRSQLRRASHQAPDFAGHYILATWGCGASCVMGAVIDAKTGTVTKIPFTISDWPLAVTEPLHYKLGSSLLIVQGSRNEKGNGTYYYHFVGDRFVLLSELETGGHE